jgi:hypothetical protein
VTAKPAFSGDPSWPQHVVHRRLEVGVAESFNDNPVHARNLAVDGFDPSTRTIVPIPTGESRAVQK